VRVAYYSPLPPERTGIAEYSALLLPALERLVEVEVVPRGRTAPARTDVSLYHVGNNPDAHGWIVEALRKRPGVVVLHDFVLHHLVAGLTLGRGDGEGYLGAMQRDAGVVGRLLAHGVLDGVVPPLWEVRPEDFPLAGEVLEHAGKTGLIVHSRYVEERSLAAGYDGPLRRIAHPAWSDPGATPADVDGAPVIGCFGNINASKRVPQLLEAFARVRERHPGARLLLVGATAAGFDLEGRLDALRLDGVVREDYVDEERLWSLMAACDVCVALRWPTMGETSGTAIRALVLGRPLVVSDVGWFSELPDAVALKVAVDGTEVETLVAALDLLASDGDVRAAMGAAAREHVTRAHDLDTIAAAYVAALEEAAGGPAVGDAVLGEVAGAAAEVGIAPDAPEAAEIATRLGEVGLGT
jgi:glycosyltransferase involved in cell wall biosynthesis